MVKKQEKIFERNVCFTFFEDYRMTAQELEADFGKEVVADYYNAIIDYALYEHPPKLSGLLKCIWPTTKTTIDKSIERRARGFTSKENAEQTETILAYKRENPTATQREIEKATGISLGKVNKVLKTYTDTITDANTSTYSNSNITSEREHEHAPLKDTEAKIESEEKKTECNNKSLEDLTDEELESIKKDYLKRVDYKDTRKRLRLNRQVSKEMQKEVDEILSRRAALAKNTEAKAQLSALPDEDITRIANYLQCESHEIEASLSCLEVTPKYFLDWLAFADGSHRDTFSFNGDLWAEKQEEYNTYLEFLKMGINANPVGVVHDFWW